VPDRTPAESLDRALDTLLAEGSLQATVASRIDSELRPLIATAERLRLALAPVPVSPIFETRLAHRVAAARLGPIPDLHVPTWLLITGAASSAALGVGVTAYAVWRGSRRPAGHRFLGR
jgi:hypothetical protein